MNPTAAETRLPRILVVDDMPDNLFLMRGLLEDRYEVMQAESGREALDVVLSANPPDLVLLDIMMPDMDGYEVMRRIRQHAPTAAIPIIFLTALASQNDERLGISLGAIDYLTKPVDPDQLVYRVDAHLRASAHRTRVEALSEKLARHLASASWERLFTGEDRQGIRFDQKHKTILFAEGAAPGGLDDRDRDHLLAEVDWLAARFGGVVDHFHDGVGIAFFDDPASCVRMAMELQRTARDLRLRIGIHTGICDIGTFRSDYETRCTLIGHETRLAAEVAATAASGSIAVSPETYALVKDEICTDASGCLVMEEFHDSDLAQVSLTPAPGSSLHGQWGSTFAGLGRD